jgi:hypothetical protein
MVAVGVRVGDGVTVGVLVAVALGVCVGVLVGGVTVPPAIKMFDASGKLIKENVPNPLTILFSK